MEIINNKALVFVTKKHQQIKAIIPRSEVLELNGDLARVMVFWGEDECRLLKNIGIKNIPHPINKDYNWPGVYRPYEHQKATASFLATNQKSYCLNELGTGKTSAAAWAADYLMNKKVIERALIICPLSIMEAAWQSDLFKTCMHRSVGIAHGSKQKRELVILGDYEFVIINPDGIKIVADTIKKANFGLFIIDEVTYFKEARSERSKVLQGLIKPNTWVWGMTATPAAQRPTDAYGIAKVVTPNTTPSSFTRFRDDIMFKINQFKWVPKKDAIDKVYALLQPAIRFTKDECLDLPDIIYMTKTVPMTPQQTKYYKALKNQMRLVVATEGITAVNAATLLSKLLQISSGCVYTDDKETIEFDIKNRYDELLDTIEQTNNKVIVFVPFTNAIELLYEKLNKDNVSVEIINGSVSLSNRTRIIKSFQTEDDPKVLLIQPQAASHGVTLTRADTVVWWGPVTSTETYLQANGRAHRNGQVNHVTVIHLQGSPVEEKLYKALQSNIDVHTALIEMFKSEGLT